MAKKTECTKCNITLTEDNRANRRAICKPCDATRMREYYRARPDLYNKHKGYVAKNDAKWRAATNTYILEVLKGSNGCIDCGENNIVTLEFDHRDPDTKSFTIGEVRSAKVRWDSFVAEIDKCDIVCANCHRIRTAKMFGSWRLEFM